MPRSPQQTDGGGMRPVENLPGRQACRALVNLLLPQYQVLQQLAVMPHSCSAGNKPESITRRCSLPTLPSTKSQEQQEQVATPGRPPQSPTVPAVAIKCGGSEPNCGGHWGVRSPTAATVWGNHSAAAGVGSTPPGGEGERQIRGHAGWAWEMQQGQATVGLTESPIVAAATAAGGDIVPLLTASPPKVEKTEKSTTMAMSKNKFSTFHQTLFPRAANESPRHPTTDPHIQPASRPTLAMGKMAPIVTVPYTTATAPTEPHVPEVQAPIGATTARVAPPPPATLAAASRAATGKTIVTAAAQPTFLHQHSAQRSGSLPSDGMASPSQTEKNVKYDGDCNSNQKHNSTKVGSRSVALVNRPVVCSEARDGRQEGNWEAFYFYHSGGIKVGALHP